MDGIEVPVPESGVLSFFLEMTDPKEKASYKIFHFPNSKSLVRWEDPFALDSPATTGSSRRGTDRPKGESLSPQKSRVFRQFLSLPTASNSPMADLALDPALSAEYKILLANTTVREGSTKCSAGPGVRKPTRQNSPYYYSSETTDRSIGHGVKACRSFLFLRKIFRPAIISESLSASGVKRLP